MFSLCFGIDAVRQTYEGERIAQEHEARGVVGQLVGNVLHVGVDRVILRQDLQRLLVNLIWRAQASAH